MAGISRAYKRRGNMIANTGGPVLCLDAGSRISYPGSGTTWTDLSGNGNTGTLTNGPTYSSANGGVIVFDGVDDYVVANNTTSISSTQTTISAFVYFTSFIEINPRIIEMSDTSNSVQILRDGGGQWKTKHSQFQLSNGSTNWGATATGMWYETTAVWDSVANTRGFYINGVAQTGSESAGVGVGNQANKVYIGIRSDLIGSTQLNGLIGSVRIYNRALSAAEISTNFNLLRGRYFKVTPSVEYLVVAGGGGGGGATGGNGGGGGGAGGFLTASGFPVVSGTPLAITVGAGGAGGTLTGFISGAVSGQNSVFSSITSTGGGYGGGSPGGDGGSGGGAGQGNYLGGSASPSGQGNGGGNGQAFNLEPYRGGGGGGAGAIGGSGGVSGSGGAGLASSIGGSEVYYAGGGGGGSYSASANAGGIGGGGAGGSSGANGTAGTANTGGGGGSGSIAGSVGGSGGSGRVIIRYADTYDAAASTTGSPTVTVAGGYRVYSWTGSGTITF